MQHLSAAVGTAGVQTTLTIQNVTVGARLQLQVALDDPSLAAAVTEALRGLAGPLQQAAEALAAQQGGGGAGAGAGVVPVVVFGGITTAFVGVPPPNPPPSPPPLPPFPPPSRMIVLEQTISVTGLPPPPTGGGAAAGGGTSLTQALLAQIVALLAPLGVPAGAVSVSTADQSVSATEVASGLVRGLLSADTDTLIADLATYFSPFVISGGAASTITTPGGGVATSLPFTASNIGSSDTALLDALAALTGRNFTTADAVLRAIAASAGGAGTAIQITGATATVGAVLRVTVTAPSTLDTAAIAEALASMGALLSQAADAVATARGASASAADLIVSLGAVSSSLMVAPPPPRRPPPPDAPRPPPRGAASSALPPPPPQLLFLDEIFAVAGLPAPAGAELGFTAVLADAVAQVLAPLGILPSSIELTAIEQTVSAEAVATALRRALGGYETDLVLEALTAAFPAYAIELGAYDAATALLEGASPRRALGVVRTTAENATAAAWDADAGEDWVAFTAANVGTTDADLAAAVAAVTSKRFPPTDPLSRDIGLSAGTPGVTEVRIDSATVGGRFRLHLVLTDPAQSDEAAAALRALERPLEEAISGIAAARAGPGGEAPADVTVAFLGITTTVVTVPPPSPPADLRPARPPPALAGLVCGVGHRPTDAGACAPCPLSVSVVVPFSVGTSPLTTASVTLVPTVTVDDLAR